VELGAKIFRGKAPIRSALSVSTVPSVKDAIRLIERDGWRKVRTRGSHSQYRHAVKRGAVTVAGKPSHDLPPGTWNNIMKQAGIKEKAGR